MNYSDYKVPQLRNICKERGIIGVNKFKRFELITTLLKADYNIIIVQFEVVDNVVINFDYLNLEGGSLIALVQLD